jgi:hypothetical protein
VICAGVRHAVELLTRVVRGKGPIALEAYGLFIFRDAIAALDVPTVPIGLDENGAVIADLDRLESPAVLLTPAHHNPHGMPRHPSRRTAVVEWAQRTGGYVFEDDYEGRIPLRPTTDRRAAGAEPGPTRLPRLGQQEPGTGAAAGMDGASRRPHRRGDQRRGRRAVLGRRARAVDDGRLHRQRPVRPPRPADAGSGTGVAVTHLSRRWPASTSASVGSRRASMFC